METIHRKVTLFERLNLSGIGREHDTDLFTVIRTEKYKPVITELRAKTSCLSKKEIQALKLASLPAYTGSCACSGGHSRQHITSLSGYIILDFDNIEDIPATKQYLSSLPFVAAVSLSCSGTGLFATVPIADPVNHFTEHWRALETFFREQGLTVDRSCKDMTRARYVSYDSDIYINGNAEIWTGIERQPTYTPPPIGLNSSKGLDKAIDYILTNHIDVTRGRDNWLKIGSTLNAYYPNAEDLFVSICQFHPSFNERECRETFHRYCSQQHRDKGVLFNILKEHNIYIKSL